MDRRVRRGVSVCLFSVLLCDADVRRMLWLLVLFMLMLFVARPVTAGEWSALLNGKAIHFDNPPGTHFNESNWGVGVQYDFDPQDRNWVPFAMASGFIDSNKNPSCYAGAGIAKRFDLGPEKYEVHADVGLVGFLMWRKNFRGDMPFLGVLPAFTLGAGRVALNMTYIPRTEPKGVPLVFFQLKVGLGKASH